MKNNADKSKNLTDIIDIITLKNIHFIFSIQERNIQEKSHLK